MISIGPHSLGSDIRYYRSCELPKGVYPLEGLVQVTWEPFLMLLSIIIMGKVQHFIHNGLHIAILRICGPRHMCGDG